MKDVIFISSLKIFLDESIEKFDGSWSYIIERKYNDCCQIIQYQENYVHKSASMIKVLILAALCDSKIDFGKKVRIDAVDCVEGGGALQEINKDAELTIEALANLMIVLSDNLATNLLINVLGMENIQRYADKLNLINTKINRTMMDFTAVDEGRENYLTVKDYNRLLWHIYNKRHEERFNKAWQILGRQQFRDRIPYYWDEEIIFHHKTGMLDGVEHDGGIYETEDHGVYSIIIFASKLPSNPIGGIQMAALGKYILDYIKDNHSIY